MMREVTKTFRVFEYNELTDDAKDAAFETWCKTASPDGRDAEWRDSLKEASAALGVEVGAWNVGIGAHDYSYRANVIGSLDVPVFDKHKTTAARYRVRLAKFIAARYRAKYGEDMDCPFTGFCADMFVVDHIKRAMRFDVTELSLEAFTESALDSFFSAWADDREYQVSRAAFEAVAGENEYLEFGTIFQG